MVEYLNTSQGSHVRLRQIITEGIQPVVLWAGAGLSTPAKLPSWGGLKKILITELEEKAEAFGPDLDSRRKLLQAAEAIENESSFWVSFQMLQQELGEASYDGAIRAHCTPAVTPSNYWIYEQFWKLGIRGIVNLNIDRLATSGWPRRETNKFDEIDERTLASFPNVIRGGGDFVFNAHGVVNDK